MPAFWLSNLVHFFPLFCKQSCYRERQKKKTKYDAKRIVFVDKICCWHTIFISIFTSREGEAERKTFSEFFSSVILFRLFLGWNTFYISSFPVHIPIFFYSVLFCVMYSNMTFLYLPLFFHFVFCSALICSHSFPISLSISLPFFFFFYVFLLLLFSL